MRFLLVNLVIFWKTMVVGRQKNRTAETPNLDCEDAVVCRLKKEIPTGFKAVAA
jgi:hypothetical protein